MHIKFYIIYTILYFYVKEKDCSTELCFCYLTISFPGGGERGNLSPIVNNATATQILVAWQDVVDEDLQLEEKGDQSGQHVKEQGGNIYAIVYGRP